MDLVKNINDLMKNASTIDTYLKGSQFDEYAVTLIQRGANFIAIKNSKGYSFYPSRFMGYKDNNADRPESNDTRNGGSTSPAISKILGELSVKDDLECEYIKYCNRLGIKPSLKKRTYWKSIHVSN